MRGSVKVYIPNYDPTRLGGGWTFCKNISIGLGDNFTTDYNQATHFLIASPSMVERADVVRARQDKLKIITRLDNALRPSRNRNTGMTRMKDFYDLADLVIFQSEWAKKFLSPYLEPLYTDVPVETRVILNGVDTKKFNKNNRNAPDDSYLYVRSSRDEGKQWIMAWYYFVNNPGTLEIVGKFSRENLEYNFDFYNGERYRFMGEQKDMADVYRRNKYFLYTYLNDANSNCLLEALASGCAIIDVYGMLQTGGAPEIMRCKDLSIDRMVNEYKEALEKL
jgi:glycosyltransferase involved in cell wall biosynthesis